MGVRWLLAGLLLAGPVCGWPVLFSSIPSRLVGVAQVVSADTMLVSANDSDPGDVSFAWEGAWIIRLAGVDAVQADQRCGWGVEQWPCGLVAREWLALLLGPRRVRCQLERGGGTMFDAGSGRVLIVPALLPSHGLDGEVLGPGREVRALVGRCAGGGRDDLGREVVGAGYAMTGLRSYREALVSAQRAGRGMWRVGRGAGFAPPDQWLRTRLESVRARRR